MSVPLEFHLSGPDISDHERSAVGKVLEGSTLALGPWVERFENQVAGGAGVSHGIATNSGTSALHLCVRILGWGDGDEIITTPFSFIASTNCLLYEGARPVFVDVDPATLNLDTEAVRRAIGPKTRGILGVDIFGSAAGMTELREVANEFGVTLLEDACEAIGALDKGRPAGSFGDLATFAFYPNKQITTGEGGMIVTDNREYAERARRLRNHGRVAGGDWLAHEELGYNYRMSELAGALGSAQMDRLEEILSRRTVVAREYCKQLDSISSIEPLWESADTSRSWFVFPVWLPPSLDRDRVRAHLLTQGVASAAYFPPLHLFTHIREATGSREGDFPVTEEAGRRLLALPFHHELGAEEISEILERLVRAVDAIEYGWV